MDVEMEQSCVLKIYYNEISTINTKKITTLKKHCG